MKNNHIAVEKTLWILFLLLITIFLFTACPPDPSSTPTPTPEGSINVNEDSYEPDNSYEQANSIDEDISQDHTLHFTEDNDYMEFFAENGKYFGMSILQGKFTSRKRAYQSSIGRLLSGDCHLLRGGVIVSGLDGVEIHAAGYWFAGVVSAVPVGSFSFIGIEACWLVAKFQSANKLT